MQRLKTWRSLGLLAIGVTFAAIGLQSAGALQLLEWALLNQWFRWRPPEARTVPVVVVTITEADIRRVGRWPLSDAQLAALLERLKRDRPAVIGLDLYRDLPIPPGHAALLKVFETTPNLVGITKAIGNTEESAVHPPPILRDRDQVGINDLLLDADGTIRRNLLAVHRNGKDMMALGTKLALMYLSQRGITAQGGANGTCVALGQATFCRLEHNTGGYVRLDMGGNQILANFLRIPGGIPSVSLTEVMNDQVPAALIQDKVVLIGAKAESVWGDRFYTPYTTNSTNTWAGVEIHANVAAQIISSAMEGRPLLQGMSEVWEWSWILFWAGIGTILGWSAHSLRWAIVFLPLFIGSILGIAYGLFLLGWWAIAVSPILAFSMAALLSRSYWVWQTLKQTNLLLELKVQERTQELIEKNFALEQARLDTETANQALEKLARTDELTQVANRRFFNEYLDQEWQRMLQAQLPFSLILIDIDFFKHYNDTYGHLVGDECLVQVAKVLKMAVQRSSTLAARYGGEEFALILSNTSLTEALQIATDIQAQIKALHIPHKTSQVSPYVTLSMGLACAIPTGQWSPAQLVRQADQALYQAKLEGRDRVVAKNLNT